MMKPRASQWWVAVGSVLVTAALISPPTAWSYEEVPVTSGGTVTGSVVLYGTPPPSRIYHLIFSPNIDFCRRISDGQGNRLLREFRTGTSGGFQNVVVAVVGVTRGKPFDYAPELVIENCRIAPYVMPIRNREPLSMVNRDPITHDVQAYTTNDPYTFAMFNQPLPAKHHATKKIRLRKGHYLFRTQCGVHDFMQSWGIAVGNPYFAVTGSDGRFVIEDLSPGMYDIIAWHTRMAIQAQRVTVPANGSVTTDFAFDASEVEVPLHDLQTGYRLETWLQPSHLVPPAVELQVR